jgi:hypothetical protein
MGPTGCPETSVAITTNQRCVTSQNSKYLTSEVHLSSNLKIKLLPHRKRTVFITNILVCLTKYCSLWGLHQMHNNSKLLIVKACGTNSNHYGLKSWYSNTYINIFFIYFFRSFFSNRKRYKRLIDPLKSGHTQWGEILLEFCTSLASWDSTFRRNGAGLWILYVTAFLETIMVAALWLHAFPSSVASPNERNLLVSHATCLTKELQFCVHPSVMDSKCSQLKPSPRLWTSQIFVKKNALSSHAFIHTWKIPTLP